MYKYFKVNLSISYNKRLERALRNNKIIDVTLR